MKVRLYEACGIMISGSIACVCWQEPHKIRVISTEFDTGELFTKEIKYLS